MIRFRPHHFLCSLAYKGMGYSTAFIENYDKIARKIRDDDETQIQVVYGLDTICSRCPHQTKANRCVNEQTIQKLDQAHASILGLRDKEILTFREAKKRLRQNMSRELFLEACRSCEWQKMGLCEAALKKLQSE